MTTTTRRRTAVLPFLVALILAGSALANTSFVYKGQRGGPGRRRIQQQPPPTDKDSKKGGGPQPRPSTTAASKDTRKASQNIKSSRNSSHQKNKSKKITTASKTGIVKLRKSSPTTITTTATGGKRSPKLQKMMAAGEPRPHISTTNSYDGSAPSAAGYWDIVASSPSLAPLSSPGSSPRSVQEDDNLAPLRNEEEEEEEERTTFVIISQDDDDDDHDNDNSNSGSGGTTITVIDENDPVGLFDCRVATELEINTALDITELDSDLSHMEDCTMDGGDSYSNSSQAWQSSRRGRGGWYKLVGTGEWLNVTACPAWVTIYQGDCGDLICTRQMQFIIHDDVDGGGCQTAEWKALDGEIYHVLVQDTTSGDNTDNDDEGYDSTVDIELSVVQVEDQELKQERTTFVIISQDDDDYNDDNSSGGTTITVIDENDPVGVFDCRVATELDIPTVLDVSKLDSDVSHVEHCAADGGSSSQVRGAWYTLVGTGEWLRVTACPALISVYQGDCGDLMCTKQVQFYDVRCQAEWKSVDGEIYHILMQDTMSGNDADDDEGYTSVVDIELSVEQVEAPSQDGNDNVPMSADETASRDDENDRIVEECKNNAIPAVMDGERITDGEFTFPLGDGFSPCESGFTLQKKDSIVEGAWFTVVGRGQFLRVSSCPFQLSVYSDGCDDLECVDGDYTDALACEFEWKTPASRDGVSYILVQSTVAGESRQGPFELRVDDLGSGPVVPTVSPNQSVPSAPPNTSPTPLTPTTNLPPDTTSIPTFDTVAPTKPPTVAPTTAPTTSPTPLPETSSPTRKPSKPPAQSPTASPETVSPTFEASMPPIDTPDTMSPNVSPTVSPSSPPISVPESLQPAAGPSTAPEPSVIPATPEPSIGAPTTDSPTFEFTIAPTDDDGDDVLVQQCLTNSIPMEAGDNITNEFRFPLSEDFVACDLEISPTKRKAIRATWISVVGEGAVLEADSCPYQLSLYTNDCEDLQCRNVTYSDARLCKFEWVTPNDGSTSRILVQSTISGFPDSGDLSFTLSINEAGQPLETAAPSMSLPPTAPPEVSLSPTSAPSPTKESSPVGLQPSTGDPSEAPTDAVTEAPTNAAMSPVPTVSEAPAILSPSPSLQTPNASPSTPSQSPEAAAPTAPQVSLSPTFAPSPTKESSPVALEPSTRDPTEAPTAAATEAPTNAATTSAPTTASTLSPVTEMPTFEATVSLTEAPSTPSAPPSTSPPTTAPTVETTTSAPITMTQSPTVVPDTSSPTSTSTVDITGTPTMIETVDITGTPTMIETSPVPTGLPTTIEPQPTISPAPTAPAPPNDDCPGALPLDLGETIVTTTQGATQEPRGLDTCFRRDFGMPAVTRPGIWYSLAARASTSSSRRLRLSACNGTEEATAPVHLTLYESDNNGCEVLTCATTINHLGCSLEFDLPLSLLRQVGFSYKLLVQQFISSDTPNAGGTFSLSFEEAQVPRNDNCVQSQYLDVGATIQATALSATAETPEVVSLCDRGNGDILERIAEKDPTPGVWYRMLVGGRVGLLASACNSPRPDLVHVTVYTGSCNDLQCLSDPDTSPAACETIWEATSSESIYFILVERVLENGTDTGDFDLSVDILYR